MSSFSVTGKKWILRKFNSTDLTFIKDNFFLDEITSKLLAIKKIKKEDINNYLNPVLKNILPNPSILTDMEKTVERTFRAIKKKEKIGIFGDYDVDGATSTAILGKYFSQINHSYEIYIPDRKSEGYGPSKQGFQKLINKGTKLIFTVDCGTLSFEPINFAYQNKIDILVLDHHQSDVKLPKAFSIVNPNRFDDRSELNYLCAAGVCFMFLIALNRELRKNNWFKDNNVSEPNLINFLDLVSLGTVCDVVPLIGVNRAIVKQGLKILNFKKNIGLKSLIDICKIENHPTPYHLGYIIGPRINAGGRVGKCSHGANLLLNENPKNSFKLASELDQFNKERQLLEKNLLKNVLNSVKNLSDPVLILDGQEWHEGIIGIIASRIKEKYNKPTIIISITDKVGKASARSVVGYDIGSIIISAVQSGILIKGGGHKMAGGFTIEKNKIDQFKEYAINKFKTLNIEISEEKKILIDSIISPTAINMNFFNKVNNLAPFGSGNSEPRFFIESVVAVNSKIVGEKHIKSVLLGEDGSTIKTIAFNATESDIGAYLMNKSKKPFNIVGKLSLNEWRGQKNVEFIIDDISVNKYEKNMVPSSIG
ncbi:MAG: single-stranded-DNA-specific exonuclease RecJ [Candidatus Pelagibacter sp.]|nr:single-stranded-DNA-specific exonuclease RecJ [Candidatus Pelagibacter sp.]RPG11596.1 MAG: single-stranded-DNA-specific exonuclease RecJ [Pelagibacteraceae bacterium TMED170]